MAQVGTQCVLTIEGYSGTLSQGYHRTLAGYRCVAGKNEASLQKGNIVMLDLPINPAAIFQTKGVYIFLKVHDLLQALGGFSVYNNNG